MYSLSNSLFIYDNRVYAILGRGCRVRYIFLWPLVDRLLDVLCVIIVATTGKETNGRYCFSTVGREREERHGERDESEELHCWDDTVYSNYMISILIKLKQ